LRLNHNGKKAIITFEFADESVENPNSAIAEELLKWFRDESASAPWIKEIKKVNIQEA
jgi:hypothetical protein